MGRAWRRGAIGVAALVLAGGPVVGVALAAPTPAKPVAPSILTGPTGTTTSPTAVFTYRNNDPRPVSFSCSLDNASFVPCPSSGTSFPSLGDGDHTFRVVTKVAGSAASDAATRSWRVDRTPPVVVLAFPAGSSAFNVDGLSAGCGTPTTPDICGTVTDATGVASLTIWIDGVAQTVALNQTKWTASATTSNGTHTVKALARDTLGNATPNGGRVIGTYTVDLLPPPAPVLTAKPVDPTTKTSPHFAFTDTEKNVRFRCRLDDGAIRNCNDGQITFDQVDLRRHCATVIALDAAGNESPAANWCWTVVGGKGLIITGDVVELLYPGTDHPIPLVLHNDGLTTIDVTSIPISIRVDPPSTCTVTPNFTITKPYTGTTHLLPGDTVNVASEQQPVLRMVETFTNQDVCQAAHLTLTYGTAGGEHP